MEREDPLERRAREAAEKKAKDRLKFGGDAEQTVFGRNRDKKRKK